jgi:hypothetical protein
MTRRRVTIDGEALELTTAELKAMRAECRNAS